MASRCGKEAIGCTLQGTETLVLSGYLCCPRCLSFLVILSWTTRLCDAYFGSEALLKCGGVHWPLVPWSFSLDVSQMSHPPDARYGRGPNEKSLQRVAGVEANAEQMLRRGAVRLRRISAISAISMASRQGPPWSTSVSRGASHCILSLPCV